MKHNDSMIFGWVLFLLLGTMVIMAFSYNAAARFLPLMFGITGQLMILLQLIYDAAPSARKVLKFVNPEGEEPAKYTDWRKFLQVVLWCSLLIVLLFWLSYLIVVPVFIFFMIKFAAREPLRIALQTSIITGVFVWILFDVLLQAQI